MSTRPVYESLIAHLSVMREAHPGPGMTIYMKGEFIDSLIKEADHADVFNRLRLDGEIFLPKSPARAGSSRETLGQKAADPSGATTRSAQGEAAPTSPQGESRSEPLEEHRARIGFASQEAAAEAHGVRQAIRAARTEVYPPPLVPKEASRTGLQGGLKARLAAALRAAARVLDASAEEPSA